jgi:predicted HNH restriction endonuclease
MWVLWTLVSILCAAVAGLSFAIMGSASRYDDESDRMAEVDEGALEGDLTAYVAEQNARAGK